MKRHLSTAIGLTIVAAGLAYLWTSAKLAEWGDRVDAWLERD